MIGRAVLWGGAAALIAAAGFWGLLTADRKPVGLVGIPPDKVADYLHAVIEANRTNYTKNIVDRMQAKGIHAEEHWLQQNALPLPVQFLMESGKLVAEKTGEIKFKLVSLSPIYVWNKPANDFERKGLEAVLRNPDRPYTGFVRNGRDRYFQAVYADRAVSQSCVDCHNSHLNSPKRDYKLNDVMGGMVITIRLGQ